MNAIEELIAAANDIPIEFDFHGNPATPEWQRFVNALEAAEAMLPVVAPELRETTESVSERDALLLLAGNQHELLIANGIQLPKGYAVPEAASTFVLEYVARRERAERAEAERDALRADGARLDWLVSNSMKKVQGRDGNWCVLDMSNGLSFITKGHPTFRSAIDAARGADPS